MLLDFLKELIIGFCKFGSPKPDAMLQHLIGFFKKFIDFFFM